MVPLTTVKDTHFALSDSCQKDRQYYFILKSALSLSIYLNFKTEVRKFELHFTSLVTVYKNCCFTYPKTTGIILPDSENRTDRFFIRLDSGHNTGT